METITRPLPVNLTPDEIQKFASEIAQRVYEKASLELKKKSIMSQMKSELDGLDSRMNVLSSLIKDGYEYREVPCEIRMSWDNGIKQIIRSDTGETIETKEIPERERQQHLELGKGDDHESQ